uniref:Beta-amyrin 28-oxidase n=1 Tax=Vitis vinifera TaxID=29760 RepID=F6GUN7_VITVI
MEFALIAAVILALFSLHFIAKILKAGKFSNLPPGSLGWPRIGETLVFLRSGEDGEPQRFIRERMDKYDSGVFKTSLLGEPMMVFCGPAGNKFLFGNENKLVSVWWPSSVRKLFRSCLVTATGDEAKRMRRMLLTFLNPDALKRYVETMDLVTQHHIRTQWEGNEEMQVYPIIKLYTFELACRLFASMDDPGHISKLAAHFNVFLKGIIDFPINFPGTKFTMQQKLQMQLGRSFESCPWKEEWPWKRKRHQLHKTCCHICL